MRHDDHRHAIAGELLHNVEHLTDHFGVKRARRFVKEHHVRLHGERAHDGDALLLPAGELRGVSVGAVGESDTLQKLHGLCLCRGLVRFFYKNGGDGQIFEHRFMREEVEMLEHHAHLPAVSVEIDLLSLRVFLLRDIRSFDDHAAGGRRFEQIERAQERRLAAAGGPDDDDHVALADREIHAVERFDRTVAEVFAEVFDLNERFTGLHGSSSFQRIRTAC